MNKLLVTLILLLSVANVQAKKFRIERGENIKVMIDKSIAPVVGTAFDIVNKDFGAVLSAEMSIVSNATEARIKVSTDKALGREAFRIEVNADGTLSIQGGDPHGVAYGMLELSRLMGVSPWEWWADATPRQLPHFTLKSDFVSEQRPSVEYRGIFINDEDWGLMPWSYKTHEPGNERGIVGAKTNARIFELLLRLRANYYWPAMHECTYPFFLTEGNREVASRYGIYIGGSHCEPMACSTAREWGIRGKGDYDYVKNAEAVRTFWTERVKDVKDQEIVYTLGMRGVHDGKMQGAKTVEEQKAVLQRVITDQRNILRQYVNDDVTKIPQVFIPYKEVLDIYNAGLEVPEDITLMWCDDNYGYIRHFPTEAERNRKGGNGVYYHISYWGRPHDYLWLCTVSPLLIFHQMNEAYERGIQKMWILNVGDIKPGEYQTELFMDMAWNIEAVRESGVKKHLENFLAREFGANLARRMTPMMESHYELARIRRPEFMGGTRTEEGNRQYWNTLRDLGWSDSERQTRIADYQRISNEAEEIGKKISSDRQDTYFQLVKYPVQAAAQMNFKFIGPLEEAYIAYDSITALTHIYNEGLDNNGKWRGMMDMRPRKLPVFNKLQDSLVGDPRYDNPPNHTVADASSQRPDPKQLQIFKFWGYEGELNGIGKYNKQKNIPLTFKTEEDSVTVEVRLIPFHPFDGNKLRFRLNIDGTAYESVEYQTVGRSEEWKQNILRGYALRTFRLPISKDKKKHTLLFSALDDGVTLHEIRIYE